MALQLNEKLMKRTVIMGYGEMQPLAPNSDVNGRPQPKNQARNRRVTIRVF